MSDQSDKLLRALRNAAKEVELLRSEKQSLLHGLTEGIAIIGMGCRYPGGVTDLDSFWRLLDGGGDAITEVPAERWNIDEWYDPDPDAPGKMTTRWGGFVQNLDRFDASFFGISPREAVSIDPQARMLLEASWEALEHAGQTQAQLMGSDTGVYVGLCGNEYQVQAVADARTINTHALLGSAHSTILGRLSYFLGLKGPNLAVDTACSSSLVAVHLACQALRRGECRMALAGGANVVLMPEGTVCFSRLRAMSPTGRCHTFSADADGYVRSEGCGIVVLKRLSDALRDGDRIHAVIRASAINQDGRSNGLTAPNGPAQEAVLRRTLALASLSPADIDYVECHGTGTTLGDPIEVQALAAVLGQGRPSHKPLLLGSVKTNIGHTEGAAGVAGLIKAVLALQHGSIPKSLHFRSPNPYIPWADLNVAVAADSVPWPRRDSPRRAGVSSIGLSGTNAHVVLEEAPPSEPPATTEPRSAELLLLSAKSEEALREQALRLRQHLEQHGDQALLDVAFSLATTRSEMDHRLAVVASSREDACALLLRAADVPSPAGVVRGQTAPGGPGKVVFVCPGQGSQWLGMAKMLSAEEPVFREHLHACDRAILQEAGFSILAELQADEASSRLAQIDVVQPLLFAVSVALAALWRSWGVEPDAVVGHSMGEVAAAHIAGGLSLKDAAAVICRRSRLLRRISGQGEMALVALSFAEAEHALRGYADRLSVAVSNSPRSTVIAGEPAALAEVVSRLSGQGVFCRPIKVDVASHSPQVDGLRADLLHALRDLTPQPATLAMRSTVTAEWLSGHELDAAYWADNLRQPVKFGDAVQALAASGHGLFVELSPHPVLTVAVEEIVQAASPPGVVVGSLRRGQADRAELLRGLGALWVSGCPLALSRLFPAGTQRVPLPTYPWQRTRYWLARPQSSARAGGEPTGHPLLGLRVPAAGAAAAFEAVLSVSSHPWLADHQVAGQVVVPAAAVAEMIRAAAAHGTQNIPVVKGLVLQAPLLLGEARGRRVQLLLSEASAEGISAALYSQSVDGGPGAEWTLHATAAVATWASASPPAQDLHGLKLRCTEALSVAEIYDTLARVGLVYGPAFQGMRALWRCPGESLAEVTLTADSSADGFGVSPALLDAAFQAVAAAEPEQVQLGMPFQIGHLVVHQAGAQAAWAHVALKDRSAGVAAVADVTLLDATGQVLVEVQSLRFQRADAAALSRASAPRIEAFYALSWPAAPLAAAATDGPAGPWAVVAAAESARARALCSRLPSCVRVPPAQLSALVSSQEPLRGVICVWEAEASESPAAAAQRLAVAGLQVAQAVLSRPGLRLWWLTQDAVAVAAGDSVQPAATSVWGLGRSLLQEHPELHPTLVDLDAADDGVDSLLRELAARDDESQVAWRRGQRYVARLQRSAAAELTQEAGVTGAGTVLITGGLGALGLHVARWLARQGVAHLLLTGRQGLHTPGAQQAVAELEALGAQVTVAALDVTDRDAVQRLLAGLPVEQPLHGVIHAAGVLEDGVIAEQTAERAARVLAPKVQGAWNLHELTQGQPLRFFVLFSSITGMLGAAGQSSYAAANSFLDGLAAYRRGLGLCGQSLAWGPWSAGGMTAALSAAQQARLERSGFKALTPAEGLTLFERALRRPEALLGVMKLQLDKVARAMAGTIPPVWRSLLQAPAQPARGGAQAAWIARLATLPAAKRAAEVEEAVKAEVARVLALRGVSQIPEDKPLFELGMDSLLAVELRNGLGQRVGRTLPATLAFDYPTVSALTRWLVEDLFSESKTVAAAVPTARGADDEPIAIVGIGCRFPGGVSSPDGFWQLLKDETDAITEVPAERWNIDEWYDPDPDAPGKMTTRWGGFVQNLDRFDASFFGISPREAVSIDPQARMLLEASWEALEHAGQTPDALMGSNTGVYIGLCGNEYMMQSMTDITTVSPYSFLGTAHSTMVGRLSYFLGLKGPNLAVDTACSSSLVTVHLACQALRQGECDLALAGGANVVLRPEGTVYFSRLRAMSPTGRCHTFSADADGYVRSEGCGIVVLKRLSDALRDGDRIHAVIRASAINQDGRSNGLTAPNGPAQEAVLRRALALAAIAPAEIDYVECHGTGTTLGDPIEVQALAAVLGQGRPSHKPLLLGSVKTNIGHTEGAAGVAGLIKAVLALQHGSIPKSLHFRSPNPYIPWADLNVSVAADSVPWPRRDSPRRAGVSSIGLSGTNAHVVLEEAPPSEPPATTEPRSAELLLLSAKSEEALREQALRLRQHLEQHGDQALLDVAFSLATTRSEMEHRLAVVGGSREKVCALLQRAAEPQDVAGAVRGATTAAAKTKVVFVCPGQGSQWLGMAKMLCAEEPVFREHLHACDGAILQEAGFSILAELQADEASSRLAQIDVVQPLLFAVSVALAALWRSWGVEPDAVVGHSMGEVAAAHIAGGLSLKDAAAVICRRSRLLRRISGQGEMAVVEQSFAEAEQALRGYGDRLSVAVSNSPRSTVIAGEPAALAEVMATLASRGVFCRRVKVDVASHSPQVDGLRADLLHALRDLTPQPATLAMRSTVTAEWLSGHELDAAYWADNLRQPVKFGDAVQALLRSGHGLFVELSPHPVLTTVVEEVAAATAIAATAVGSLRRGQPEREELLRGLGTLWVKGQRLVPQRLFPPGAARVPLPTYPWQRQRYFLDTKPEVRRAAATDVVADWCYRVDWPVIPRDPRQGNLASPGQWLVLADADGVGAAVASALLARGCTCAMARDVSEARQWLNAATRAAADAGPLRGVIYLLGLDAKPPALESGDEVGAATAQALAPLSDLLRALAAMPQAPMLWVVTRGAYSVGEQAQVAPCQAALAGMARVVSLEHPTLWGGLIDLDPQISPSEVDDLLAEVLAPSAEDQLAYRGGRRHAARLAAAPPDPQTASLTLSAERSYLVTGGLGGIGLRVASWLVERGARHVVLTSRHGLPDRALWTTEQPSEQRVRITAVQELEARGATLRIALADVADLGAMQALLASIDPPLAGVVHAAGVNLVRPLVETDEALLATVLRPKVVGSWVLHQALRAQPLDLFVLFSSGAAVWGGQGQGAYAAANAFLDGLAQHRRAQSLPALSIAWGVWADGGMADAKARSALGTLGVLPMATDSALSALERLLGSGATQRVVTRMHWPRFTELYMATGRRNLLAHFAGTRETPAPATAGPPSRSWRGQSAKEARASLRQVVQHMVANVLGHTDATALDPARGFAEQGLDSIMAVQLRNQLQAELQVPLSATMFFDHPSVDRLVEHLLADVLQLENTQAQPATRAVTVDEPIAIVGAACRFPGGIEDLESYWKLLAAGGSTITEVPESRWSTADFYDPNPEALGRTYVKRGGFLREIESFDPGFFRISPREALSLDPQQRLVLEVGWEALENAGQVAADLRESPTGVFVGVGFNEYTERMKDRSDNQAGSYVASGNAISFASGRLSYFLGLHGPSLSVDTACSSSLVALHLGCQSLRQGECDRALAGGVNVLLSPQSFIALSRMRALSADGRCKTFSADADGYGRAEGCGMVVLKRLSDAQRDGDRILAIVRGSAVNHDGPSSGLTVPNGPAQQAVLKRALLQAGVAPADVDFVECHGTGTRLGDPIEVRALGAIYGEGRSAEQPLLLGTAKAFLGHLESAAGMAGLIKVLLSLAHEQIPAQPSFAKLNPLLPWDSLPVAVVREPQPWPRGEKPRRAGVSGFGLSGTNAHLVLEEAPRPAAEPSSATASPPAVLLLLSAKTDEALRMQAARLRDHLLQHPEQSLLDTAYSLATTRSPMEHRLAVVAQSREALLEALHHAAAGDRAPGVVQGVSSSGRGKLAFLFPGQGSQRLGMGRELHGEWPVFRAAFDRCADLFDQQLNPPLREVMWAAPDSDAARRLDQTAYTQAALFGLGYALDALWESWGIRADLLAGHSIGELVAACVAGVYALEDAVRLVAARGLLMQSLPSGGAMMSIAATEADVQAVIAQGDGAVAIAAINGPEQAVISGDEADVEAVGAAFLARGVKTKRLVVSHAFHSPRMTPMLDSFAQVAESLRYAAPQRPVVSNLSGRLSEAAELSQPGYWVRHVREAVRFSQGVQALASAGAETFIELGPQAVLLGLVAACLPERSPALLPSLRAGKSECASILEALASWWVQGGSLDAAALFPAAAKRVPLPTYPWQHARYWIEPLPVAASRAGEPTHHPLLGVRVPAVGHGALFEAVLGPSSPAWLADHRIAGQVVAPLAVLAELIRAAAAHATGRPSQISHLRLHEPLVLTQPRGRRIQVILDGKNANEVTVTLHSQGLDSGPAASWVEHASASAEILAQAPALAPLDLEALSLRCAEPVETAPQYDRLAELGLVHGAAFRGLGSLRRGGRELLATLALPAEVRADGYGVSPPLLDAAFQAVAAAFSPAASQLLQPVAIGRLMVLDAGAREAWVHAELGEPSASDMLTATVRLCDRSGALLVLAQDVRLQPVDPAALTSGVSGLDLPGSEDFQLQLRAKGTFDGLYLAPAERRAPAAGEVEIELRAAGLNFRDVLSALDVYPGEAASLGSECAGVVVAVGEGVTGLAAGDAVMAVSLGCFRRYVTVDARLVAAIPTGLSFEQAATLPIAFLTAWYALHDVAGLQPGERLLVHAAAGGVGMAAVQVGRMMGAEVVATASPSKWPAVQALGVSRLASSRSLDFASTLRHPESGRGVDVVLNSLTGERVDASLSLLSPGGRLLELGKTDLRDAQQVAATYPGVHYRAFDLWEAGVVRIREMLASISAALAAGDLQPLPLRSFAVTDAVAAFRFMGQAKHVGKIVLVPPPEHGLFAVQRPQRSDSAQAAQPGHETWASRLAGLSPAKREAELRELLKTEVAKVMSLPSGSAVPEDRPLSELGMDSLLAVELRNALGQRVGRMLPATLAFDYPTVAALARWLLETIWTATQPAATPAPVETHSASNEPIAIVGMGCRFPGGVSSPESLWQLLVAETDAISEVPKERWNIDEWYDPDPDAAGKMTTRWGGFVANLDRFDAGFFGISPREAVDLDPQARMLLEASWEALESAGQTPERLMGSETGVYMGLCSNEYVMQTMADLRTMSAYALTGTAHSTMVGRLSYFLGLKGPNLAVDTACSSSLVAVHLACQALRQGDCEMALAGGANVVLMPEGTVYFSRVRAMSPTGRCHTFSADADGYVRSEGCGVVVLKRLSDAQRDGDRILAVVRGSAVNQDGRSNGPTAPNGPSQEAVIRKALAQAGVAPAEVDYVECHGTGTPLGDPIEVQALGAVLGQGRDVSKPVVLSSIKTNIGHTEGAAGVAGLIKAVLALEHERIPKSLHYRKPNPYIPWSDLKVAVAAEAVAWPRRDLPRRAGVSSFGFSGTNSHVVIEEAPHAASELPSQESLQILPLSAKSHEALSALAGQYVRTLSEQPTKSWADLTFTASLRRSHHDHRLALVAKSGAEARGLLDAWLAGDAPAGVAQGSGGAVQKLAFVFSGQGSQWVGMGRDLLAREPVFQAALAACEDLVQRFAGFSLRQQLDADAQGSRLAETEVAQPALFAIQIALVDLLRSWGIVPSAVIGHSVGEVAAAYVAGALTLAQAVQLVVLRGRLMQRATGQGQMASVALSPQQAAEAIRGYEDRLGIAAINDPDSVVLSGEPQALAAVLVELSRRQVSCRDLRVQYAFHSPQMNPLQAELVQTLPDLHPGEAALPMYSTVSGARVAGNELDATYWGQNLRQPVQLAAAMATAMGDGYRTFVEIGAHPVLSMHIEQCLAHASLKGQVINTLRRGSDEARSLFQTVAGLYAGGYRVDWKPFYPEPRRCLDLPTYPWDRKHYWNESPVPRSRSEQSASDTTPGLLSFLDAQDDTAFAASLGITATTGEDSAALARVLAALRGRVQQARTQLEIDGWTHAIDWQSKPLPAPPPSSQPAAGLWVVLLDESGIGEALAAVLEASGGTCLRVRWGQEFSQQGPQLWTVDARSPKELGAWWSAQIRARGGVRGIVHLWSVSQPAPGQDMLDHAFAQGVHSALSWLQAVVETDSRQRPKLWFVTRGAVQVGSDDPLSAPEHAPLWGLGRVVALEHPDLWGGLVDLPAAPLADAVARLRDQIVYADGEDQVAVRATGRFVPRLLRRAPKPERTWPGPAAGTVLITGGLGALGLHVARWLLASGYRSLVLLGRRGVPSPETAAAIEELRGSGASVAVMAADVADLPALEKVLAQIAAHGPPLSGIVHAAGVLDDGVLMRQSASRFATVMAPKVRGAWNLHLLTQSIRLDFFVMFSSMSSVLGVPGQGNYAAANAFLDALALLRQARGLPGHSMNWGAWSDGGMAGDQLIKDLLKHGMRPLRPQQAVQAIRATLSGSSAQVMVVDVDWPRFRPAYERGGERPLLAELPRAAAAEASSADPALLGQLRSAAARERTGLMQTWLRRTAAEIMGLDSPDQINPASGFFDSGMDSLMTLELLRRVQQTLGLTLRATVTFKYPSVDALSGFLLDELSLTPSPEPVAAAATSPASEGSQPALADLSEDEAAQLLEAQLAEHEDFLS